MYFLVLAISFYLEVYFAELLVNSLHRAIKASYLFVSYLARRIAIFVRNFTENHEENIELLQQFLCELSVCNVRLENQFRLYVDNCDFDPSLIKRARKLLNGSNARKTEANSRNRACESTSTRAKTKLKAPSPTCRLAEKHFDLNNNFISIVNQCEFEEMTGAQGDRGTNSPIREESPVTKVINYNDSNFIFFGDRDSIPLPTNNLDSSSDSDLSCVVGIELDRKTPLTNIHASIREEEKLFGPILTIFKNTLQKKKNLHVNKVYEEVISNIRPFMETQLNDAAVQSIERAKAYENILRSQAWKDARILENMIEKKCQQIGKTSNAYEHQLSRETELKTKVIWQPYTL